MLPYGHFTSPLLRAILADGHPPIPEDIVYFIVFDGVKIVKRGYPNTPQARTWVSLEPGWEVRGLERIEILRRGVLVQRAAAVRSYSPS
jgi:hypothetical protein